MADRPKIDEFVFVLLAGLVLIIIFMVGFPSIQQQGGNANESANVTNATAGNVTRFVSLGDFTVSYSLGTEVLGSKTNVDFYKGYFSELDANLIGSISDSKLAILTGATLTIIVDNTNNLGPLIVLINGQQIYDNYTSVGTVVIPVDKSLLKSSNVVSIQTDYSDWRFWDRSYYHIQSAKLEIQYQGSSFKDFDFTIGSDEFNSFQYASLTFNLNTAGESLSNSLKIAINGNEFFHNVPPLLSFSKEIIKPFLQLGDNRISFSADPTATYNIQSATITIVHSQS